MQSLDQELSIEMNTEVKKPLRNRLLGTSGNDHQNFDFELWARAVRPQLLAALQKHSGERTID